MEITIRGKTQIETYTCPGHGSGQEISILKYIVAQK